MHTVVKLEDCVTECLSQRKEYDEKMTELKNLAKQQAEVLDHQRAHIDKQRDLFLEKLETEFETLHKIIDLKKAQLAQKI